MMRLNALAACFLACGAAARLAAGAGLNVESVDLGSVAVGRSGSSVTFYEPAFDRASYVVGIANPEPVHRIDAWLLAKGGKALAVQEPHLRCPPPDGRRAKVFSFDHAADRADVVAVVLSVDGVLTTLQVPPAVVR